MAMYRDGEKKTRDRKKLGKKARLRGWRKETFGDAEGIEGVFKGNPRTAVAREEGEKEKGMRHAKKKRKRTKTAIQGKA